MTNMVGSSFFSIPPSNDDSCQIGITGIDYTSSMKTWLYPELPHTTVSFGLVIFNVC
jgi:hypothetical protein